MSASNMRVFVTWQNATVFAGEDVACTITFKNVAPREGRSRSPARKQNGFVHSSTRPSVSRASSYASQKPPPPPLPVGSHGGQKPGRSLSTILPGTDAAAATSRDKSAAGRPARGHARSGSLQIVPGRPSSYPVNSPGHRSGTHPSPRVGGISSPSIVHDSPSEFAFPARSGRRKASNSFSQSFKFPAAPPTEDETSPEGRNAAQNRRPSPRLPNDNRRAPTTHLTDSLSPVARIISGSSMDGTSRSSGEFYSMSNNSTETLASEYIGHPSGQTRLLPRPMHQRRGSHLAPPVRQSRPESLMMGYAQIMGSFTLDGSLINQAPFEEVKRKGVVGGQGGGGVVGVERTKRESGLFGALGWGNIGESLGGLLGSSDPSSIRDMNRMATMKTVPLISTPQSILFVDLKLAPGESRSYTYSFTIPRGLPPSHKGKSMKVTYHLTIGTQRAGSTKDQQVKQVEVPFRVFGSVNSRGEILGHDLMSPYIILQDQARTTNLDTPPASPSKRASVSAKPDTFTDFLSYVENLLDRPRQNSSMGLLSPSETIPGRFPTLQEPQTMKESIDTAILRSNLTDASNQSANRFEIARSGRRVAVIKLARPAYRLGETLSAVIDFTGARIPCYSVHMALETSEKVDPAIALRSNASIYRVTKKSHASLSFNALFAQRLAFSPTIPPAATPEFITSGVSLEWKLRVEFVTPRVGHHEGTATRTPVGDDLLEEIARDDRGVILAAAQRLMAESFEIHVPIRVYGAVSGAQDTADKGGWPV